MKKVGYGFVSQPFCLEQTRIVAQSNGSGSSSTVLSPAEASKAKKTSRNAFSRKK